VWEPRYHSAAMAEPPRTKGPPPIPPRPSTGPPPVRGSVAASGAITAPTAQGTAVSGVPDDPELARGTRNPGDTSTTSGRFDDDEGTRPFVSPIAGAVIDQLVEALAAEAETLLAAHADPAADRRLADLEVQLALIAWDIADDPDDAARHLELAEHHPLAPALRLAAAMDAGPRIAAALAAVEPALAGVEPPARRAELLRELAEAYLYRAAEPARAHAAVTQLLAIPDGDKPADPIAVLADDPDLAHLAAVAASAVGDDDAAATAILAGVDTAGLIAGTMTAAGAGAVAAAGAALLDRRHDPAAALELCWTAIARDVDDTTAIGVHALVWLRVVDLGIEAALRQGDPRVAELLAERNGLLAADPSAVTERAAAELLGALARQHRGDHDDAFAPLDRLADPAREPPGLGARIAAFGALHAAVAAERHRDAIAARERLAGPESAEAAGVHVPGWTVVHAWRALELADAASLGDAAAVPTLARHHARVHALLPSAESARIGERLHLADPAALIAILDGQPGAGARRAAAVAETRLADDGRAMRLLRARLAELTDGAADDAGAARSELIHLARLLRRVRDGGGLAIVYDRLADAAGDGRERAAYGNAAAAMHLTQGRLADAEAALLEVTAAAPDDLAARIALAALYRRTQRWPELATALSALSETVASPELKGKLVREHAEILRRDLGDAAGARVVLEAALVDSPDDAQVLRGLAALYDDAGDFGRAAELRRRVLELVDDPLEESEILIDIGRTEAARGDDVAALAAFERAAGLDPASPDAIRGQIDVHRRADRLAAVVALLRQELTRLDEPAARLPVHLEIADLVRPDDPAAAIAAWLEVLAVEPDHAAALAGVEQLARATQRWDDLATALRTAPRTPARLAALADALEHAGQWAELAAVRRIQLDAAAMPADRAALALALAALYEHRLADAEQALRMVQLAHQTLPSDDTYRELVRLLEAAGRFTELTGLLERELAGVPPADVERQLALLTQLGELRQTRLAKPADAALAYEAILERRPGHPAALAALEAIYHRLGRDKDLARVLELKADAVPDVKARAPIYIQIAKLRQQRNDVDGAIAAFRAAIAAEPGNRDAFTQLERLCYKTERWTTVLDLYDAALADVEGGARSYRLGDLYARKGQVLLDYLHQLPAAAAAYAKVVELEAGDEAAVAALGKIAERTKDWSPLIDALERRADHARDPAKRVAAMRQAAVTARDHAEDPAVAARLYHRVVALDPRDTEALDALELHYERAGEWAKLIDALRMRVEISAAGDVQLGLIRRIAQISEEKLRDVDVAIEHYTRILEQDPTHSGALEALGRIYESTEQWAEFVDITRRQIRITTDRNTKALLYFKCGSVMEAKFGREEDAIRYYDAAIKTSAACMPAVHGLRDLYRRREDWPRVIQTLELEVKLWTDDKERAGVFAQIGRIHDQRLGDPARAMTYYESALSVDPDCVPANQALFEHYFDARDWERAAPLAQALAQKAMREGDPAARSDFYWRRGVVLDETGDAKSGAESFIVALEIRPTNAAALDALTGLARREPDSYDFEATLHELEKQYKRRDDAGPLLARVYVGQAHLIERLGDLDAAGARYDLAAELAAGDFTVLSSLLDYYCDLRRWHDAVDAIGRFLDAAPPPDDEVRVKALLRRVEIHADGEMNPTAAIAVLRQIIELDPAELDAYYQLAQQCYLLGRFTDARAAIDRVIELSTAPGATLSAAALARYYYYKGRILDAAGDQRGAAPQYRRATEYDPGYAPPALVLARRAAEAGDQRLAESVLIDAAHAAMGQGGPRAAVPLQRGLARILLAAGDRPAAIEAYRGILNVEPDSPSDRLALAEIYAVDEPLRAIHELRKVIDRDIHNAPAYRLLASFYSRIGEAERASRVLAVMEQLGYAEDADRNTAARLRSGVLPVPLRRPLEDDLRERLLVNPVARDPLGEIFAACAAEITALFPAPPMGERLAPIQTVDDSVTRALVNETTRLFATDAEVYVGDKVPAMAQVMAFPRRVLVIDRTLLAEIEPARRYLLGWALDAIRGGYALLLQLGARQRRELAALMRALTQPEIDRPGQANDFVRTLPRRAKMVVDRHAGRVEDPDAEGWLDGMIASAKRGGILACDDFAAATWMVARLAGETPDRSEGTRALGAVLGGADLVRFFVSDDYSRLRSELATPSNLSPG
jgi:Tfp pilus assembly protein PilF